MVRAGILTLVMGVSIWANAASARADYTVSANVSEVFPGDTIQVCWTASPAGASDWVGVYPVGNNNQSYTTYFYTNGLASGCQNVIATYIAGDYEFRYLPNNEYVHTATSQVVKVKCLADNNCLDADLCTTNKCIQSACYFRSFGPSEIVLAATPNPAPVSGVLNVCWTVPAQYGSSGDWIAISQVGSIDEAWVTYAFTTGGADQGCMDMTAPAIVGPYELRYFGRSSSCVLGRSGAFSVCDPVTNEACTCYRNLDCDDENLCSADRCETGGCINDHPPYEQYSLSVCQREAAPGFPLTVCWDAPDGRPTVDWIALYIEDGTTYHNWFYTGGIPTGCGSVPAPQAGGMKEFRYLLNGGFCATAKSATIEVCPNCGFVYSENVPALANCLLGPGTSSSPQCADLDFDCNQRIDLRDYSIFQRYYDEALP